ncbi:MAG TPA: hypothetical protein VFQ35_15995, partial [Polyangiaceae bacterium]|nr:hypothetical protein [Polyangiaceae bacterium]
RVELALGEHLFAVPYTKNALPQQPFDGTTLEQLMADGPAAIQGRVVHLIEVEVVDRAAQHLDWEKWLRAGMTRPIAVVRKSVVRPRALDVPLTYPLRWLTLRSQGPDRYGPPLKSEFDLVFSVADAREAVIVDDAEEDEVIAFRRTVAWPTAEVIHFDHPPLMNVEALFDLTASWQTRLVLFETPTPTELAETAGRLADLGGPAVLIVKPGLRFPLCLSLVHDEPLDWLAFQLASEDLILVGGAGREDLLRVSRIARMLESTELDRTIQEQLQTAPNDAELELGFAGGTPADTSFLSSFRSVEARTLSELSFDQERRGTLPSAHLVRKLQAAVRSARTPTPPLRAPTEANERRHVNAVLHHVSERERSLLDSAYGWVEPLQELELAVQIGARIEGLRTIGSAAFLEEAVLWDADAQQTILEVGVTSLDFELFGAPVQRIALPRTGDSAIATFRLKAKAETRIPGVARLRFCLYHGNTLIQSFRVAVAHGKQPPDGEELQNAFQRALDLSHEHAALLRGVAGGYFARLEYSAFDLEHIRDFKPRRVSFFVNDSEGEVVVTTKGDEIFSGEISPNLTGYVSEARNTLKNSSYALDAEGGLIPNVYRFFNEKKLNVGDEVAYDAALCDLAAAGFDLYSALVPRDDQAKFERALSEPRQIVHAGHLKLDGVVPWNLLYLRQFDDKSGKPTKACSAPVEGSRCGDHPDCPLHTSNAARGFTDTTTACPRYFLGFRQLVEVPPQQVQGIKQTLAEQSETASSMNRVIVCGPKVRTLVGYNPALRL